MIDSQLKHLVAVARAGSFTAAARVVGRTQSAVTRSIADLERRIGYAIFHRTARGVVPTERGSDFVERAERLLDHARELFDPDGEPKDPYAGPLRIGVCPASLEWYLVEPLARLLKRYPGVRFELIGASFERMLPQLRSGSVDLAIGFDDAFSAWSDLRSEVVGTLEGGLFVRKGHPLASVKRIERARLAEFAFVSPSESRPYGAVIRNLYNDAGIAWQKQLHLIDYFPAVKRIVATSDAIGVVVKSYTDNPTFLEQFEILDGVRLFSESNLCCAVRAKWEPKPAARALISEIRATYRSSP